MSRNTLMPLRGSTIKGDAEVSWIRLLSTLLSRVLDT